MSNKELVKSVAYFRTSSLTNAGEGKDSEQRQREAVMAFAKSAGFQIVDTYHDEGVKGSDPIETRPGFAALLDRIEGNGVRVVIVEDASRFARDLVTQELGILALIALGVRVFTATGDDLTNTEDPFKVAMRQIAGAFAQLEKARLVAKLRHARERKRAATGRCEGRKGYADRDATLAAAAKKLDRYPVNGRKRTLREIASALAEQGHVTASGAPLSASVVARLVRG